VLALLGCGGEPAGRPTAGFEPVGLFPVGEHPVTIAVLDVDLDGDPDVLVPGVVTPDLTLLRNDGGRLTALAPAPLAAGTVSVFAADLDGDGPAELVASLTEVDQVQVLRVSASGEATVLSSASVPDPGPLAAGDVDGDGRIDVVAIESGTGAAVLLRGDGAGGLAPGETIETPELTSSLWIGDLDRDGAADVAMTGADLDEIWLRAAAGSARATTASWPMGLVAAQLDGDPALELAGAANLGDVLFVADLAGGALEVRTIASTGQPAAVGAGDFDGDGLTDLVSVAKGGDRLDLLLGDGAGALRYELSVATGWGPSAIAVVDLDQDGCPDVLTVNAFSNDVSALRCAPRR